MSSAQRDAAVQRALAHEAGGRWLLARAAWEGVARSFGSSGEVLERLAACCEKVPLLPDAWLYYAAAAAAYDASADAAAAQRAMAAAQALAAHRPGPDAPLPALALAVLDEHGDRPFVAPLLS